MSTKLYKIHLKREGKDREGIQKLLIVDINKNHASAKELFHEVMKPHENELTAELMERAVEKVMKTQV